MYVRYQCTSIGVGMGSFPFPSTVHSPLPLPRLMRFLCLIPIGNPIPIHISRRLDLRMGPLRTRVVEQHAAKSLHTHAHTYIIRTYTRTYVRTEPRTTKSRFVYCRRDIPSLPSSTLSTFLVVCQLLHLCPRNNLLCPVHTHYF